MNEGRLDLETEEVKHCVRETQLVAVEEKRGERDADTTPDSVAQPLKLDDALTHTVPVGLCDTDPEKDNELLVLDDTDTLRLATVDTDAV